MTTEVCTPIGWFWPESCGSQWPSDLVRAGTSAFGVIDATGRHLIYVDVGGIAR